MPSVFPVFGPEIIWLLRYDYSPGLSSPTDLLGSQIGTSQTEIAFDFDSSASSPKDPCSFAPSKTALSTPYHRITRAMKSRTAWAMSCLMPHRPVPTFRFHCTPHKSLPVPRFLPPLIAKLQIPLSNAHHVQLAPSPPHLILKTGWRLEEATRKRTARAGPESRQEVARVEQQSCGETGAYACGIMTDAYPPLSSLSVPIRLKSVYVGKGTGCIREFVRILEFILRATR